MSVLPCIHYGELPLVVGGFKPVEADIGELDTLNFDLLVAEPWRTSATAAGYGRGVKITAGGYHSMWVQSRAGEQESEDTAQVAILCVGLLDAGDKRKRVIAAAGKVVSVGPIEKTVLVVNREESGTDAETGDPAPAKRRIPKLDSEGEVVSKIIVTPSGSGERWNINEAIVTVTDTYFTTTAPDTTLVGTAVTPTTAPSVPAYLWASYGEPMRFHHPNGWVLDDREVEQLFSGSGGAGLWRVTDRFGYYQLATPD